MRKGITFLIFSLLFVSSIVGLSDEEQKFLDEVNDVRAKYAKDYNLPNMHKLVWSEHLVSILNGLDWDWGTWPEARKTWRYTRLNTLQNISDVIDKEIEPFLNVATTGKPEDAVYSMDSLELLSPVQTVIGCSSKTYVYCLVGAEGNAQLWDLKAKSSENPGSACLPHYKNEDRFCVPVNSAEVSYFGFRQDFVDGINEKRRSFAKLYHIPNMHELIWNQDLVDIAVTLNWVDNQPQAGQTWRYSLISSFRKYDLEKFEKYINMFSDKSEQEKKDYITRLKEDSLFEVEFMNPEQTRIGCGKMADDLDFVCLIGNLGNWTELSYDTNSNVAPGSKCLAGYENTDGLCTVALPTTPLPVTQRIPQPEKQIKQTAGAEAAGAETAEADKEPDMAPTRYSPYFMICIVTVLFLF
ncbi:hypothetical protein CAEBREN_23066 [Caenorhabditis brenneri]|uniref:Uncharacterized protein n=1 Tax=Caenorhabditis brenneri TaxID=135651 RepID=G0MDQ1_CAEBE|nr:hypothetical protein CAEBREN_23066 [Caenorhabditis brenneri]